MSNPKIAWAHGVVRTVAVITVLLTAPRLVLMVYPPAAPQPKPSTAPAVTPYVPQARGPSTLPPGAYGYPAPPNPICDVPKPSSTAKVLMFGAYEGAGMSDFGAAGPDAETSLIQVIVSPSPTPIYAILTANESLVWAFEGDSSTIERVVVRKGSAVSGLPASKVSILTDGACVPYFYEAGGSDQIKAIRSAKDIVGRDVDIVAGNYQVERLDLPGMSFKAGKFEGWQTAVPQGFDPMSYSIAIRYAPAGVFHVDPAKIVSGPEGRPYEVLPQGFGISQLVGKGLLKAMSNSDEFRIEKPIPRFPAGLNGGHSVKFVLARGVPMPAGSPGHSCVLSEETGQGMGPAASLCR